RMHNLRNHIGDIGYLITSKLSPFKIFRRIFLCPWVVAVLLFEHLYGYWVVTVIPGWIFAILSNIVFRPKGCREDNIHITIVINRNPLKSLNFTIRFNFFADILFYSGNYR